MTVERGQLTGKESKQIIGQKGTANLSEIPVICSLRTVNLFY